MDLKPNLEFPVGTEEVYENSKYFCFTFCVSSQISKGHLTLQTRSVVVLF